MNGNVSLGILATVFDIWMFSESGILATMFDIGTLSDIVMTASEESMRRCVADAEKGRREESLSSFCP
jgi:hypothetical protein